MLQCEMSLIHVNVNFKLWSFYLTCLVIVRDHVTYVGGYLFLVSCFLGMVILTWVQDQKKFFFHHRRVLLVLCHSRVPSWVYILHWMRRSTLLLKQGCCTPIGWLCHRLLDVMEVILGFGPSLPSYSILKVLRDAKNPKIDKLSTLAVLPEKGY